MGIDETAAESSSRGETGNGLPEESSSGAAGSGAGTTAAASRDQGFAIDQRHLMDCMWNYFAGKPADTATSSSSSASPAAAAAKITMSDRSRLYFQHKGHSCTVVGIQRKQQILAADSSASNISNSSSSSAQEDFILVLDPSEMTRDIVKCLSAQTGWQKLLKRSTQTLRHPEYQLCYVEPGIVYGEGHKNLKLLSSVHYTYWPHGSYHRKKKMVQLWAFFILTMQFLWAFHHHFRKMILSLSWSFLYSFLSNSCEPEAFTTTSGEWSKDWDESFFNPSKAIFVNKRHSPPLQQNDVESQELGTT